MLSWQNSWTKILTITKVRPYKKKKDFLFLVGQTEIIIPSLHLSLNKCSLITNVALSLKYHFMNKTDLHTIKAKCPIIKGLDIYIRIVLKYNVFCVIKPQQDIQTKLLHITLYRTRVKSLRRFLQPISGEKKIVIFRFSLSNIAMLDLSTIVILAIIGH